MCIYIIVKYFTIPHVPKTCAVCTSLQLKYNRQFFRNLETSTIFQSSWTALCVSWRCTVCYNRFAKIHTNRQRFTNIFAVANHKHANWQTHLETEWGVKTSSWVNLRWILIPMYIHSRNAHNMTMYALKLSLIIKHGLCHFVPSIITSLFFALQRTSPSTQHFKCRMQHKTNPEGLH